ncbi:hypothetical protein BHM03_00055351 [Ensete ventricosum]|nr:hypothetical protein BHM03_00055351 [Ensete ventricosum]
MTRAIELQSDDEFRSSLSIRSSLDDAMGSRQEFTRRFAEGIGKLAGSTLITDNNVNKMFDEMLMLVRVLRFVYIPCTASSGLAVGLVREIANTKDSVLMQELVHGRWSVRGHPKRRVFMRASELALDESLSHQYMGVVYHPGRSPSLTFRGMVNPLRERHHKDNAIEHQNFLFDMERIHPWATKICNKFNTLLDLERCSGDCMGEGSQSSKCIYWGRTRHKLFSKTE